MIERMANPIKMAAMGRVKKMKGDPCEIRSDCWREVSSI
jgi:hypothetical protein